MCNPFIKNIIIFIILLILFLCCKEVDWKFTTRGYYTDKEHYEVIAYGKAPDNEKNQVKARNMAQEAALITAQKKVHEEFKVDANKIIKSGRIKEVKFSSPQYSCRIVYVVNVKTLSPALTGGLKEEK